MFVYPGSCTYISTWKGDILVRRGVSVIGSGVEDQISEIIIFTFLLHIPIARYMKLNRKENQQYVFCTSILCIRSRVHPLCSSLLRELGLIKRRTTLTGLFAQRYQRTKLVSILKRFYGKHQGLVNPYNVAISRLMSDHFCHSQAINGLSKHRTLQFPYLTTYPFKLICMVGRSIFTKKCLFSIDD